MTTLQIKQLNSTECVTITSAEQKRLYGGFALLDNMITSHETDDKRKEGVLQIYADGGADITNVNKAFATFENESGKKVLMSLI